MQRRLAAILCADVVGYTARMERDEAGTLAALKALREGLTVPQIAAHRGRLVKLMGDGMLVEFASVVDALKCAVAIQEGLRKRAAEAAPDRWIELRIGISLGDVVVDGDDLYGDGVNVAARLEKLADPQGICVSRAVMEQARGKLDLAFDPLGKRPLKGVSEPVEVYSVSPSTSPRALADSAALPAEAAPRPSIAVLPFRNLSVDPEQEYFGDGIVEDILTLLARNRWLLVVARNSSFAYRGREVDVREVGEALGARYILEGSVRKAGGRVRITVQLLNAADGGHIWAQRYDRELHDIFELQEDIAQTIAAMIEPELAGVERETARRKPPHSLNAWDYYQRGLWHLDRFTYEGLAEAERLFGRAIAIDPGFARAHAGQAYVCVQEAIYGDPAQRHAVLDAALASAQRAVACDGRDAFCRFALGRAHSLRRESAEAIAALEAAIDLNPSFAQAYYALGFTLVASGRAAEAIPLFQKALRLSPRDPHLWTFHHMRSLAHFRLGELAEAEDYVRRAAREPTATYRPFATLAAVLGARGKHDEARAARQALLDRRPNYSLGSARQDLFYTDETDFIERYLDGLRVAGVPE